MQPFSMRRPSVRRTGLLALLLTLTAPPAWSELTQVQEYQIDDSEESYDRRIYSYQFDIDANGTIHLIYARPAPNALPANLEENPALGQNRTQIIYAKKTIGGGWAPQTGANSQQILEEKGKLGSISTAIQVDSAGTVHVSYLVSKEMKDANGVAHKEWLVYQQIKDGKPSAAIPVASGAFHTRMQLDGDNRPIFIREGEVFAKDGVLLPQPFARTLRLYRPTGENTWQMNELHNSLPSLGAPAPAASTYPHPYFRVADFAYDPARKRFHLTYGDKNADFLRSAYPTCNQGHCSVNPVYFPPGTGHNLRYAYSDDGMTWVPSNIDISGTLSENEFWTTLVLNGNGAPYAAMYRYATQPNGYHGGSSNIVGRYDATANAWNMIPVAGQSTYPGVPHVAGMGPGLAIDSAGGIHGVWDNSPPQPIDADGANGNTMYRYSPDGQNWTTRQMLIPYSVEGNCRVKLFNQKLVALVLGDYKNARLMLVEADVPSASASLYEVQTNKRLYAPGETVQFYNRIQGAVGGDYYLLAQGPFDKINGTYRALSTTKLYSLNPDRTWTAIAAKANAKPAASASGSITAPPACASANQCDYQVPFDSAGFYIAEITLPAGSAQEGVFGLSVSSDASSGGFNSGAILRENGEFPGFTTFTLTAAEAVNITAYEYTGATQQLQTRISVQDANGNRTVVYGPVTMKSGETKTTGVLQPGFYVSEVFSATGVGRGRFGISLNGQRFDGSVNIGGWIDSKTGGRGEGFGAFYASKPQTMAINLLFGASYPPIGVAGPLNMDILRLQADGSRAVHWSTDAAKMPAVSSQIPTLFAKAPFITAPAKSGAPFAYPATYRIFSKRTVENGGSYDAAAVSPEFITEIHINDR